METADFGRECVQLRAFPLLSSDAALWCVSRFRNIQDLSAFHPFREYYSATYLQERAVKSLDVPVLPAGAGEYVKSEDEYTWSELVFTFFILVFTSSELLFQISELEFTFSILVFTLSELLFTFLEHEFTFSELLFTFSEHEFTKSELEFAFSILGNRATGPAATLDALRLQGFIVSSLDIPRGNREAPL